VAFGYAHYQFRLRRLGGFIMESEPIIHCEYVIVSDAGTLIAAGLDPTIDVSEEPSRPDHIVFTQLAFLVYLSGLRDIDDESLWSWAITINEDAKMDVPIKIVVPYGAKQQQGLYIHTGNLLMNQNLLRRCTTVSVTLTRSTDRIQSRSFPIINSKEVDN